MAFQSREPFPKEMMIYKIVQKLSDKLIRLRAYYYCTCVLISS